MKGPSNDKIFSAAEIERYHSGQMSAAERHALEKAALDDPFLADALEGYTFTATPAEDIRILQERLQKRTSKKGLVVWLGQNTWARAAVLLLFAGVAGWLLLHSDLQKEKTIAGGAPETRTVTPPAEKVQPPAVTDSITFQNKSTEENAPVTTNSALNTERADRPEQEVKRPTQQLTKSIPQKEPSAQKRTEGELVRAPEPTTRDLVTGQQKEENLAQRRARSTNSGPFLNNRNFSNDIASKNIQADSNALAMHLQDKVAGVEVTKDSVKNLNIVLKPLEGSMNEVVVVGYGAKNKKSERLQGRIEESEPAEGWGNFNDYVAQNLVEPQELREKAISGEVELSFEVNKEGEAVNIRVEKSLCSKCDEEAVRLLKEGPKWKKKKKKKGRLAIHF